MARISALKSKMSSGKINPGEYQLTEGAWLEKESKKGDQNIHYHITLVDRSGSPIPFEPFAMSTTAYGTNDRVVEVNKKGQLVTIGDANVKFNRGMGAGKFFDSLNDQGFSVPKLDNIDVNPDGVDGQWVYIDLVAGNGKDANGNPYTDVVVTKLLDGPKGGGAKRSSAASKPAAEEEEESSGEGASEELSYSDDQIAAASHYMGELLASPGDYVKNFDSDAEQLTLAQVHTPVFSKGKDVAKEHGVKVAELARVVGDPAFHAQHTEGWDGDDGTIALPKPKKSGGGGKKK